MCAVEDGPSVRDHVACPDAGVAAEFGVEDGGAVTAALDDGGFAVSLAG